jgi:1-aminocyclopropane-1-carboxylate deaminase/D-cysteine desulfhydrase-like pyridoxal-dependent ACC family enzyme
VDGEREDQMRCLREVADEQRARGRTVYLALIADERDKWLQAAAYVSGYLEMLDQATARGIRVDHIYAATLEATHGGLLVGILGCDSPTRLRAISPNEASVWPGRTIEEEVARVANEVADNLGIPLGVTPADVDITTRHAGPRYGAVTAEALEALRLFGRTEALILDPVYTAKGAAGLIHEIREGRVGPDDTVVFWHTGGAPALFAYAAELGFSLDERPAGVAATPGGPA